MKRGLLITFEGPDGSGKSTQIDFLKKYLEKKGLPAISTREPGGTEISEKIRGIILDNNNSNMCDMCEALLYAASRAQLVNEVIKPALEQGIMVICDRFVESSIIYQGIGRELGIERIKNINEAALNGLQADLTFMLTIPYEIGLKRKANQKTLDRLENEGNCFHKKVFDGYMKVAQGSEKIKIIDGSKAIDLVHNDIIEKLEEYLKIN